MIYFIEEKLSALVLTPKEPSPPSRPEPTPAPNTNTTVIRELNICPSEQFEGNPKLFQGFFYNVTSLSVELLTLMPLTPLESHT